MIKDYGIDRVIEPKGSIPVTAWKLDNSKKIRPNEVRVSLELIDFERDNLDQLASIAGYGKAETAERIMTIHIPNPAEYSRESSRPRAKKADWNPRD